MQRGEHSILVSGDHRTESWEVGQQLVQEALLERIRPPPRGLVPAVIRSDEIVVGNWAADMRSLAFPMSRSRSGELSHQERLPVVIHLDQVA